MERDRQPQALDSVRHHRDWADEERLDRAIELTWYVIKCVATIAVLIGILWVLAWEYNTLEGLGGAGLFFYRRRGRLRCSAPVTNNIVKGGDPIRCGRRSKYYVADGEGNPWTIYGHLGDQHSVCEMHVGDARRARGNAAMLGHEPLHVKLIPF